jgi:hypothetical protein
VREKSYVAKEIVRSDVLFVYHVRIPSALPAWFRDQSLSDAPFTGELPPCVLRQTGPGVAVTVSSSAPERAIIDAELGALAVPDGLLEEVGVESVVVPQPVIAARVPMTKTTSPILGDTEASY